MKFANIFCVIFCSIFISVMEVNGLTFADINNMEDLIRMQSKVNHYYSAFMRFVLSAREKRTLTENVARLEVEHWKAMKNITHYLSNPINAYRLVKRLFLDFQFVREVAKLENIDFQNGNKTIFTNETMMLASFAIFNLQVQYNLSVKDISNGILKIDKSSIYPDAKNDNYFIEKVTPLTSTDCFVLAVWIAKEKEFQAALEWLNEARRKFPDECHGNNDCLYSLVHYTEFEHSISVQAAKPHKRSNLMMPIISNPLCSGERYQQGLTCQYQYGPHPLLRLARFKTETIHKDPDVTMFHDVINDEEIAVFERLSSKRWRTATIACQIEDHIEERNAEPCSKVRMGQVAHIIDLLDDKLKKLSRRVLDMSGRMGQSLAELWNVARYGPGGYYKEHFDALPSWTNYRSSSTMFYLSDVQIGGATTFNELEISINPKKYSAIHWNNIIPSKGFDSRTVHASCPLVFGEKMIALKWLSEFIDYCPSQEYKEFLQKTNHTDDKISAPPSVPLFQLSYDFENIGKLHQHTAVKI